MFATKHYVPILKAKEGEFKALEETPAATKNLMTPLFEIIGIPWNYVDEEDSKTIEEHLSKLGRKIFDCWGNERRIFIDSNYLDGDRKMSDGVTHHLIAVFNDLRNRGINAIPVTGLDRHNDYKTAVRTISAQDGRGICLRLINGDLTKPTLSQIIDADLQYYGLTPDQTDLVVDFGSIEGSSPDLLTLTFTTMINNVIPYINNWRSLTIAASSFPPDLSDISANTIDTIDRNEWIIWTNLLASNLTRFPSFGDYSIAHPDIVELDPRFLSMSASIRYTHDLYWLIVRGRVIKRFGSAQYYNLCQNLIVRPEYSGPAFSWGDNYINECAAQNVGVGNPTTWRKVGNNHHFQQTVTLISSLP